MKPIKLLILSDCHLEAQSQQKAPSSVSNIAFEKVVQNIKQCCSHPSSQAAFDLIIGLGDICQHGDLQSYLYFKTQIEMLQPADYVVLPGNHDISATMVKVFDKKSVQSMQVASFGTLQLIMLNSQWPNKEAGRLSPDLMQTLKQQLSEQQCVSTLIFLHHPVLNLDTPWMDKIALTNAQAFLDLCVQFPHVKAIVHGHAHQDRELSYQHLAIHSIPSTAYQYKPHCEDVEIDSGGPAYAIITSDEQQQIRRQTVYVD
ncbi:MAG: metallophosphoesterase [Gammaproteobacteria bacterium]|nr:metallophosphoesterase [Gammaproteobacteria bacterium]